MEEYRTEFSGKLILSLGQKIFFMCLLVFIFGLGFCAKASAATWYVATDGSDSTGNGAIGTPWKTLYKALNCTGACTVQPGDTVQLRAGTYNEPDGGNARSYIYYNPTTPGAAITIQPYPSESVTINIASDITGAYMFKSANAVVWTGESFTNLLNFTNTNSKTANFALLTGSAANTYNNCSIDGNNVAANQVGLNLSSYTGTLTVTRSVISRFVGGSYGMILQQNER